MAEDNKNTARTAEQGFSDSIGAFKKAGGLVKSSAFKSFSKGAAKSLVKFGKWILNFLISSMGSLFFVTILVVIMLTLTFSSVFGWKEKDFDKIDSVDAMDAIMGEVCEANKGNTYVKIEREFLNKFTSLKPIVRNYLISETTDNKVIETINNMRTDPEISNIELKNWKYYGSYSSKPDKHHEYYVDIEIPIKLTGTDKPKEFLDTIVGYMQANYGVINMYTDETVKNIIRGKETVYARLGQVTREGVEMTEEYCKEKKGSIIGGACAYFSDVTSTKQVAKTGVCTYKNNEWENKGDETYECTTDDWNYYKSEKRGSKKPKNGDTYKYPYFYEEDGVLAEIEDFNLDVFDVAIQKYIDSGKLFYYKENEILKELKNKIVIEKKNEEKEAKETIPSTCTYVATGWSGASPLCDDLKDIGKRGDKKTVYEEKTYTIHVEKTKIYVKDNNQINFSIYTGIDSSDKDFLGEEKEKTIKNLEIINTKEGIVSTGEYSYNQALNEIVETLNFACPNNKINLSLITGGTYSSFSAITGAVDAPGVFSNKDFWYDSSGPNGVWDENQLRRQDVYNAIWSYAATGVGNVSGWFRNGRQVGTPQCTDFVHARFFAQYGFDCGYGNGQDIATDTVRKFPDKFTTGSIDGALTIKAGSIISKVEGVYGHVGFVEAIETSDDGNIVSITISDANFNLPGCAGGVRLMCKYTWEQFVSAWGLNCIFAVPIYFF